MIIIENKGYNSKKINFFDEVSRKILKKLSERPYSISELSKELNMSQQLINYYLNKKLKYFVEKKKINGKIKYFSYKVYYDIVNEKEDFIFEKLVIDNEKLQPFIKDGVLNSYIVLGSPDPHGPFSARSRDLHYVGFLLFALGKYFNSFLDEDFIKLDVDLINENKLNNNLILIGGPVTNLVLYKINTSLKVRFLQEYNWDVFSEFRNHRYSEETVGIICNIKNPFYEDKKILIFAGKRAIGTKLSIKYFIKNFADFDLRKEFYIIIQGFDEDGDGKYEKVKKIEENIF